MRVGGVDRYGEQVYNIEKGGIKMDFLLDAQWTDDCCGKKDYDGEVISISTRYWPAGGGYMIFNTADGVLRKSEEIDKSPPHAHSSLILRVKDDEYVTLIETDIKGKTFEEVKDKVEAWAQSQYKSLIDLLRQHYKFTASFLKGTKE